MNSSQPSSPSLSLQLITISIITLQRTREHNLITSGNPLNSTYDYIVIGAGSAGSTVGSRLSESPNSVLVLEAGGPQTVLTDMPAVERGLVGSDVDWAYRTTAQRAGLAYGGHVPIPRGRVLGGSHNLNYMVYSRGNRRDFDRWAHVYGASGWSFDEVLPYFLRSENNTDMNIVNANPGYHSTTGRMVVKTPINPDPILMKFMDMIVSNGFPIVDQNGPTQLGINLFQQTIYLNGTRSTTASAFLEAYRSRPNLQVLTRAFATKILFSTNTTSSNATVKAIGVVFEYNGSNHTVYARNEIILCAGILSLNQTIEPLLQMYTFEASKYRKGL